MRGRALAPLAALVAAACSAPAAFAQQNAQGVDFPAVAGQPFTGNVATFVGTAMPTDYSAGISWGDSSSRSAGTVAQALPCPFPDFTCFEVTGTHTYAAPGTYAVDVALSGPDGTTRVTATAMVTAPAQPPAPPPPPPPPPGGPVARITLLTPEVNPGEAAIIDASGSSGEIQLFAFDLNGNGTYETKTSSPRASTIHTLPGTKRLGVQVVTTSGATATADTTLSVAGRAVKPPAGAKPLEPGTVVGSPHTGAIDAPLKNYLCPVTVQVGVAEATIPQEKTFPPTLGEPCFERVSAPTNPGGFYLADDYPQFVAGKERLFVNGLELDTRPNPNAGNNNLVIYEKKKIVTQKNPGWQPVVMRLGQSGFGTLISEHFMLGTWDVASAGTVGTFPIEDFFGPTLMGLPVVAKDTPLKFVTGHRSELQVFVTPPFNLTALGQQNSPTGQTPLTVRADNTDGMQVEGSIIASGGKYELDLPLGIFHLKGTLTYAKQGDSNVWSGDVNLRIPDTPVDNIDGHIVFRDGSFEQANVKAPFERPGLGPIGCCIYLVGLEGKLTPNSIQGSATFAAGPDLIGDYRAAEVTATVSIQYSPFVMALTAKPLKIVKWDVGATTQVVITPTKFFANAFWVGDLTVLDWRLNVETMIANPWYIAGGGTACAGVWPLEGCANVHGAAGPKGVTVCAGLDIGVTAIEGGLRVPWNPLSAGDYSTYSGCTFALVKAKVSAARAAAIRAHGAASYPVRVAPGLRAALFVINGRGAQPQVSLRGPDGTTITTPPDGVDVTRGRDWLAVRETNDNSVHVMVGKPAAGRWMVRNLAGSPAVRSVGLAPALPRRFARGRISGRGRTRTLHYRVSKASGTRVTFVERAGDQSETDPEQRVEQAIGRAKGARGKIEFSPAEARVRARRIEAVVESQGAVITTETVARFDAPRFSLPAAPRVRARRAGRNLIARWSEVVGARAYQVFVNRSDGHTRYLRRSARRRSVMLSGLSGLSSATIEVRAISPAGYIGRPGRARLRPQRAFAVARSMPIARVLRTGRFSARCIAAGEGRCEVRMRKATRLLAHGQTRRLRRGRSGRVSVRLTRAGTRTLRAAHRSGRAVAAMLEPMLPGVGVPDVGVRFR